MSIQWEEPKPKKYEYGKPPSIWISVFLFVVTYIAAFVITTLTWKQGKPVISATFFVRILLVPLLIGGALSSAVYTHYEDWTERVDFWNNLREVIHARWRWWAGARVAIIGSVTLTPVEDLGVRMLRLEGSAPSNAGKTLALAADNKESSISRVQQVMEQLVVPFVPRMTAVAGRQTFSIMLQSDRDEDVNDLRALLRKLAPRHVGFVQIKQVAEPIDVGLIEKWFESQSVPDYCLVLAYQLHATGTEPVCSEAAVSILFASRTVIDNSKGTIKPEAWLFRPIQAAMDRVHDRLRTLLAAEQTPNDRIKHLWLSNVPAKGKHAAQAAVKDTDLKLEIQDVDAAIGLPGPVNALLAQALAAQMVQHGQDTQLIATAYKAAIMLNLVGTSIAPVPDAREYTPRPIDVSVLIGLTCIAFLVMLGLDSADASAGWIVAVLVGYIVFIALSAFTTILRRDEVRRDFNSELPW